MCLASGPAAPALRRDIDELDPDIAAIFLPVDRWQGATFTMLEDTVADQEITRKTGGLVRGVAVIPERDERGELKADLHVYGVRSGDCGEMYLKSELIKDLKVADFSAGHATVRSEMSGVTITLHAKAL